MQDFKVMCIALMVMGRTPAHLKGLKFTSPEIGDICTVIDTNKSGGLLFYTLAEHEFTVEFDSRAFATLPEQTADEMQEEVRESITNLETILV